MTNDNENKDKERRADSRTQIILAMVGLIGTVTVAITANWDKLSASNKAASPTPSSAVSTNPASSTTPSLPTTTINQPLPTTPSSLSITESSNNSRHSRIYVDNTHWKVKYPNFLEDSSGDWLFKKMVR
ncbi:hypothetical protein [Phormidesmis priestleyi]